MLESGVVIKSRTSSANIHILCSSPLIVIPFISGSSLIAWAKGSINKANKVGLRGHPWRVPLSRRIVCDRCPFILVLAVGEEYNDLIHVMKQSLKPNLASTLYKYSQPTESKAFSASRLTNIAPILVEVT